MNMDGVFTGASIKRVVMIALTALMLSSCSNVSGKPLHGFTFLQDSKITLDNPLSRESLRRMKQTGANAVVLVPFLRQSKISSGEIGFSDAVTDHQLLTAIDNARRLNLKVILKPQILVKYGWAGDIRFGSDVDEERWFVRYHDLLSYYARLAQREHVDALVIGTELTGIETSQRWHGLIADMRKIYRGRLTYAAHDVESVKRFIAWKDLDAVSVNLYPKLGDSMDPALIREHVEASLAELKQATQNLSRPVWVLEVGIPSAEGALRTPWDWYRLSEEGAKPDPEVQNIAIRQWLKALEKPWIDAVFIWCWYSDPYAGGIDNNDYTLQNKPAEKQVNCLWGGDCIGIRQ